METSHHRTLKILFITLTLLLVGIGAFYLGSIVERNRQTRALENALSVDTAEVLEKSTLPETTLTDEAVIDALNQNVHREQYTLQDTSYGKGYQFGGPGEGIGMVNAIHRGDLDGDGYGDALIEELTCGASCGFYFSVVLNLKDGTGKMLEGFQTPEAIMTSSAAKTAIESVVIDNGIVTITAKGFYGDWDSRRSETKQFRFENNQLVEIK